MPLPFFFLVGYWRLPTKPPLFQSGPTADPPPHDAVGVELGVPTLLSPPKSRERDSTVLLVTGLAVADTVGDTVDDGV
jgi:hypothetical protein